MTVDWITLKYLTYSFFEDDETQEFFHYLNPEVKLPMRNYLKTEVEFRFEQKQDIVMKILSSNSSRISFTIDGWSSIAHRSYYGITGHFISDDWSLNSLVVDFVPSNGHHTGRDIAEIFFNSLEKYNLLSKLQGITVDNASSNTSFMEYLSRLIPEFNAYEQHYRCFAHILHLGVMAFLNVLKIDNIPESNENREFEESDSDIEDENLNSDENERKSPLSKLRALFSLLKNSEQWKNKLHVCCNVCNVKALSPNIDVGTRWNSTLAMLTLAFEMKPAIIMLCENNIKLTKYILNIQEWGLLEIGSTYLQDFKILSDRLSGEKYVTLPSVVIGFNMLLDKLENAKNDLILKDNRTPMDDILLEALERLLEKLLKHYRKCHWGYCVVLLLDPRFKKETFQLTQWGKEMAKESVKKFEQTYKTTYYNKPQLSKEVTQSSSKQKNNNTSEALDVDALFVSDSEEDECSSSVNSTSNWRYELDYYYVQKRAPKSTDVLKWWEKNEKTLPNLAKMARDFFSVTATSVPSERLFSRSSLIVRKHRNKLSNQSIKHLICLNSWNSCSLTSKINSMLDTTKK